MSTMNFYENFYVDNAPRYSPMRLINDARKITQNLSLDIIGSVAFSKIKQISKRVRITSNR
jgi:hypothetical protein